MLSKSLTFSVKSLTAFEIAEMSTVDTPPPTAHTPVAPPPRPV